MARPAQTRRIADALIKRLGGMARRDVEVAKTRAYESGFDDGGNDEPASGSLASFGYRRASGDHIRDFGGLDYDTVLNSAWRLMLMSPVARRYLQLKRDYELGRGVDIKAEDTELQAWLARFWESNEMQIRLKRFVYQYHAFGEQCFPVFVRHSDGRVKLAYIDPAEIEKVIQHPDNALEKWAVVLKVTVVAVDEPWRTQTGRRVYRIVREDEGVLMEPDGELTPPTYEDRLVIAEQSQLQPWEIEMLKYYGLEAYTGSCFYFSRNDLSNQSRGYTDLLQVADWIDQDETILFDLADRENVSGYFVGDVALEGADEEQVAARAKSIRTNPPKKGSFNVHNTKETWSLQAPDLKQAGSVETHNATQTHVWGGLGLPNAWYGRGDETNRATAQAQSDPTWKTMASDQDEIYYMIFSILRFVRDQAIIAGQFFASENIKLILPEMTKKDLTQIGGALSSVSVALSMGEDRGWITRATAIEVMAKLLAEIDVSIDPEDIEDEAEGDEDGKLSSGWLDQHGVLLPDYMAQPAGAD